MLQVGHPAGLCNRVDVIATGYVLAKERGEEEIEVSWPVNSHMPASFHEIFTRLPHGQIIERSVDSTILEHYHAAVKSLPPNYRDSDFYCKMLAALMANVIPEIQSELSTFLEEHFRRNPGSGVGTVGVHIRRYEHPQTNWIKTSVTICEFAQPLRYYEAAMRSFPRTTRFFVSTDAQDAFHWLQARFGDRVFQQPKAHDNRSSTAGVREGLVDLLLLSKCDVVIGTGRSSFSHIAALIGRRPIVRLTAYPKIPSDWPNFDWRRWLWAYRHFLVESTFWKVWWLYSVRPRAFNLAGIPPRGLRMAWRLVKSTPIKRPRR